MNAATMHGLLTYLLCLPDSRYAMPGNSQLQEQERFLLREPSNSGGSAKASAVLGRTSSGLTGFYELQLGDKNHNSTEPMKGHGSSNTPQPVKGI